MSARRLIQYGIAGTLGIVLLGVAFYLFENAGEPASTAATAPSDSPTTADDEPTLPTEAQRDRVMQLVAEARRLAGDAKFPQADAALQKADQVITNSPEVAQARHDIAEMQTPAGQLATQLTRARFAVEHGEYSAAEKALDEAQRLDAHAPEIAELRQQMETARARDTRRGNRITEHLTAMREAIARHDFAAADSALDAAERIAVDDLSVRQARVELARARTAYEKKDGDK